MTQPADDTPMTMPEFYHALGVAGRAIDVYERAGMSVSSVQVAIRNAFHPMVSIEDRKNPELFERYCPETQASPPPHSEWAEHGPHTKKQLVERLLVEYGRVITKQEALLSPELSDTGDHEADRDCGAHPKETANIVRNVIQKTLEALSHQYVVRPLPPLPPELQQDQGLPGLR